MVVGGAAWVRSRSLVFLMASAEPAGGGGEGRPRGADLVVVANRLPIRGVERDGHWEWELSSGGLVSALVPVLGESEGVWIGWAGATGGEGPVPAQFEGIELGAVPITAAEYDEFYLGFANATLWPLYHDAIRPATFDRAWWRAYVAVNERYAAAATNAAAPGATVWVHDYQLQLVPAMVRGLRPDLRIGFFLHIPFPPRELFMQLPWRRQILEGLLGADLVGFQVPGGASNFARLARRVAGATGTDSRVEFEGRQVRVNAFPISVNTAELIHRATDPGVQARAREIRVELGNPEIVMLGVDRLDYTKGIDRRLRAVGELFAEGTLRASRHVLVQIAVPSREEDPHYQREREHLEQLVGEINGEHASVGQPPIHYLYQSVSLDELVALYLAADVMLVTPLRDGMNLVAKEYVACRVDASGALVLSEFAGAAQELRSAILVNPHDLDGLKEAITRAVTLDATEATARMRRLRRVVRRNDVHAWARGFLAALRDR
jgi:trehalose 6-phosphate synthase